MVNVIDNTIMNSSVMWPTGTSEAGNRLPAGQVNTDLTSERSSLIVRSPSPSDGRGWLPLGMGNKVDLMA
jgi:hypothetical protein